MYIILVYDIGEERLQKVLQLCRIYLTWVQNSVFEGEITQANLHRLKNRLRHIIDLNLDSVVIYKLTSRKYVSKETIGVSKGEVETIL